MTATLSLGGIVSLAHDSARPITRQYCVELSTVSGMMEPSWARGPRVGSATCSAPTGGDHKQQEEKAHERSVS